MNIYKKNIKYKLKIIIFINLSLFRQIKVEANRRLICNLSNKIYLFIRSIETKSKLNYHKNIMMMYFQSYQVFQNSN
jgi:hypothetical protein